MINEISNAFKGYLQWVKNIMLNGGLIIVIGILFVVLPLTYFMYNGWIILSIMWFLLSDIFIASFLAYYFIDYKESLKENKKK